MMDKEELSIPTIIGVVFIVLKLTKVIDWKWIWVLSPFWIPAVIIIAIIIIYFILILIESI